MLPPEVPGAGELLCTGMTGCSPSQRESNPSASAFCATIAVSIGCRPENSEIPMFIIASFPVRLEQHSTCATCQLHALNAVQDLVRFSNDIPDQFTPQQNLYGYGCPAVCRRA